jgi:hypothetical protein
LSARSNIENTLYRYTWAFDLDELDLLDECFTPDAEVDFEGDLKVGRPAVIAELRQRREKYRRDGATPWHSVTNLFITDETADRVAAKAFWHFFMRTSDGTYAFLMFGFYDDIFVRDGDVWRIESRRVLHVS